MHVSIQQSYYSDMLIRLLYFKACAVVNLHKSFFKTCHIPKAMWVRIVLERLFDANMPAACGFLLVLLASVVNAGLPES